MAKRLREVMKGKSEEGLVDYLDNFYKYTPEAISAAVDELKDEVESLAKRTQKNINLKIESRIKAENEEDVLPRLNKTPTERSQATGLVRSNTTQTNRDYFLGQEFDISIR